MGILRSIVRKELETYLGDIVVTLDPSKFYIITIPTDLDLDQVRESFDSLRGKLNIIVLQADNVKVLELS